LHNEELHCSYASETVIRVIKSRGIKWAGHVARMGGINSCNILVGKPEGRRPHGRDSHRWENNVKTELRETR